MTGERTKRTLEGGWAGIPNRSGTKQHKSFLTLLYIMFTYLCFSLQTRRGCDENFTEDSSYAGTTTTQRSRGNGGDHDDGGGRYRKPGSHPDFYADIYCYVVCQSGDIYSDFSSFFQFSHSNTGSSDGVWNDLPATQDVGENAQASYYEQSSYTMNHMARRCNGNFTAAQSPRYALVKYMSGQIYAIMATVRGAGIVTHWAIGFILCTQSWFSPYLLLGCSCLLLYYMIQGHFLSLIITKLSRHWQEDITSMVWTTYVSDPVVNCNHARLCFRMYWPPSHFMLQLWNGVSGTGRGVDRTIGSQATLDPLADGLRTTPVTRTLMLGRSRSLVRVLKPHDLVKYLLSDNWTRHISGNFEQTKTNGICSWTLQYNDKQSVDCIWRSNEYYGNPGWTPKAGRASRLKHNLEHSIEQSGTNSRPHMFMKDKLYALCYPNSMYVYLYSDVTPYLPTPYLVRIQGDAVYDDIWLMLTVVVWNQKVNDNGIDISKTYDAPIHEPVRNQPQETSYDVSTSIIRQRGQHGIFRDGQSGCVRQGYIYNEHRNNVRCRYEKSSRRHGVSGCIKQSDTGNKQPGDIVNSSIIASDGQYEEIYKFCLRAQSFLNILSDHLVCNLECSLTCSISSDLNVWKGVCFVEGIGVGIHVFRVCIRLPIQPIHGKYK